jgi:LacI family transcriptional regulator
MSDDQHTWKRQYHVTLNDVAREAGVSQSAASVVLNGAQSGTRISRDKRRQVVEVAERMGYRPNALARSLISGRTNLIGVYSGRSRLDSRNAFYADLLGGVFEGATRNGVNTVVHTTGSEPRHLLELVSNRAIDGLIIHASHDDPILRLLGEFRLPAVSVADVVEGVPAVVADDQLGGSLQARHLAVLGHKHVLLKDSPYHASAQARCSAFEREAKNLGLRVTHRYQVRYEPEGLDMEDMRLIAEGPDRATAVVAWSDYIANEICIKLNDIGVSIPQDVAVVGFDGFKELISPKYRLTTIRAPWAEVGAAATDIVSSLIARSAVPNLTVLPVEFVRGETT